MSDDDEKKIHPSLIWGGVAFLIALIISMANMSGCWHIMP
jgi:hypothetical protein